MNYVQEITCHFNNRNYVNWKHAFYLWNIPIWQQMQVFQVSKTHSRSVRLLSHCMNLWRNYGSQCLFRHPWKMKYLSDATYTCSGAACLQRYNLWMNGNMNCSSTTWLVLPLGSWEGAQDKLYTIEAALSNWQVLALNHLLELTTTKEIQIATGSTITVLSNGLMYSQLHIFTVWINLPAYKMSFLLPEWNHENKTLISKLKQEFGSFYFFLTTK